MRLLGIIVAFAVLVAAPQPGGSQISSNAQDDKFVVRGSWGAKPSVHQVQTPRPTFETRRTQPVFCGTLSPGSEASAVPCVDGAESGSALRQCADGTRALGPLMRRELDASGVPISEWERVDNGGCPEDPAPSVVLSAAEFRRLPLAAAVPVIQPSDGRALINLGVAVHTDGSPQELTTSVVGVPVRVRATPVRFVWDFGDGSAPVVTATAGSGWPSHAALAAYAEPGTFELGLTTTWRGEFQVAGAGPWLPVDGTATTTSSPVTITVETAPTRLVADR